MSNPTRQNAAKLISSLMMAHYENGFECFLEFTEEDERVDGVVEYMDSIRSMYDNDNAECLSLRLEILEQLKISLNIPTS